MWFEVSKMKKIILLIVAILSVTACAQQTEKKNYLKKENLNGKVKSIREIEYIATIKDDKIEKKQIRKMQFSQYDKEGKKVEEQFYKPNGKPDVKHTHKYDGKGDLVRIEAEWADFVGLFTGLNIYTYDNKGNLIEEETYDSEKFVYKYDEKGNLVERSQLFDEDKREKTLYKYDDEGNKIEAYIYNSDEVLQFKSTYMYDKKGNLVEEIRDHDSEGYTLEIEYKYEYDSYGNWIRKILTYDDYPESITEREIEYY